MKAADVRWAEPGRKGGSRSRARALTKWRSRVLDRPPTSAISETSGDPRGARSPPPKEPGPSVDREPPACHRVEEHYVEPGRDPRARANTSAKDQPGARTSQARRQQIRRRTRARLALIGCGCDHREQDPRHPGKSSCSGPLAFAQAANRRGAKPQENRSGRSRSTIQASRIHLEADSSGDQTHKKGTRSRPDQVPFFQLQPNCQWQLLISRRLARSLLRQRRSCRRSAPDRRPSRTRS